MKWIEKNWKAVMALALLTMAMSFEVTMYPPGGFSKQGDPERLLPGLPKLASSWSRAYLCLVILCATAFVASTTTVLSLVMGEISFIMSKAFEWGRMVMMVMLALAISSISQFYGLYLQMLVVPRYATTFYVLMSFIRIWSYLMLFLLLGYLIFLVVKFVQRKIIE